MIVEIINFREVHDIWVVKACLMTRCIWIRPKSRIRIWIGKGEKRMVLGDTMCKVHRQLTDWEISVVKKNKRQTFKDRICKEPRWMKKTRSNNEESKRNLKAFNLIMK